jgi:hypothetical protein
MASDDPGVLRSFIDSYPEGSDSDHVRARLGRLEPTPKWSTSRRALVGLGVFAVMLVTGAVLFWVKNNPMPPSTQQAPAASVSQPGDSRRRAGRDSIVRNEDSSGAGSR